MSGYELEDQGPQLTEDEYSDLLERAQKINELPDDPAFRLWVDFVNSIRIEKERHVRRGGCKSLEDYARETGWLDGVEFALEGVPHLVNARVAEYRQRLDDQRET